ncbi:MAG TPA: leucyl/phenylalanyl-tRNA--protein transferase [Vicinamibacterales bacterium]|nr:leucyl/phenylalanyl-tRNA--protein transferase [Vicinamibacterales bacterium]
MNSSPARQDSSTQMAIPSELLLTAYASGWFPMAVDGGQIRWFSPDPRGIIPLERFHVPRRVARLYRRGVFRLEVNRDFPAVIRACAATARDEEDPGSWISEEIIESYIALHEIGVAHSVEAWAGNRLAGGLYGVALGGAFFGESMFHRESGASKVALVALVERLHSRGYTLLDTQWVTPHLEQFGAVEISRTDYLGRLDAAIRAQCSFT